MATFRTKARAVDLLGKQQIRDEVTAISELLRNSYDADANFGTIDINTSQNQIIISDDGEGMTKKDIEEKWLTLGTHSKTNNTTKTKKGRVRIGEKGIGRLAISLLGDQLLLISKKANEWCLLYLHWELFRNEHMFLEDIQIPIKVFKTFKELINFFENEFSEFKNQLLNNFLDKDVWAKETVLKVTKQIAEFKITNKVLSEVYKVEQNENGTIFHISHMDDMWIWDSFLSKTKDKSMERRHTRLVGTLYSFENPIAKFDKEVEEEETSFIPSIIINGFNLRDQTWFNEEDINLYDYSIKGEIKNGKFSGACKIKYSENNTEEFIVEDVLLTQGLNSKNIKDCGPLTINWYFVEGEAHNSALNKESHKRIKDKLEEIGGIYVFRDGLRILPYGEPGNDFLEVEVTRSRRASNFPFSFRRMFGYIEISKVHNGKLLDKSSREGFIENQYYLYFKEITFNLLAWWAYDFLETKDQMSGRRKIRLEKFEDERKQLEAQKQEEKKQRNYLKDLQKRVENTPSELKRNVISIESSFNSIMNDLRNNVAKPDKQFRKHISDSFVQIQLRTNEMTNSLDSLLINPNLRFTPPNILLESIENVNNEIKEAKSKLKIYFQRVIQEEERLIVRKYENSLNSEQDTLNDTLDQINSLISEINGSPRIIKNFKDVHQNKLANEMNNIINMILDEYSANLDSEFEWFEEEQKIISVGVNELTVLQSELESADLFTNVSSLLNKTKNLLRKLKNKQALIHQKIIEVSNNISTKDFHRKVENTVRSFNNFIQNNEYTDDQLIGILKKEVDMYRDISAVGLAAELTSHEFNALYQEIKRNFRILDSKLKNTSLNPVLQKSHRAFRSLERLHERMSPLYRQSRNIRSEIKLNGFVNTLTEYFSTDLKRYDIKIINDIPEDVVIKEVEAVLFTPLVNIISNSIYWLLNQENRQIHFYMDYMAKKLYIQDTGPGIKPTDIPYVFEPYFTKKVGGRGLGLFLSRDILEHKGHNFYVINPNDTFTNLSGACFCIEFNSKVVLTGGNHNE
ncbi:ATP-binding protein [Bacillus spizizenii]|nr:ATP-binding protein [Bacillus spizizenii]